jgi:plastocyanin
LIFCGLDLLYGILPDLRNLALFDPFIGIVGIFIALCFVSAFGTLLTQKRWSFVLAAIVSLGFVVPSLAVYPSPDDFRTFAVATSSIPILVLVASISILCLRNLKKGLGNKKYLASPSSLSGVLAAAILLIVVVGISIGAYAGGSTSPGSGIMISIVAGASNPTNAGGHFSPSMTVVVIGVNNTVTWVNNDFTIHTITSDSGSFSSGLLNSGDKWTYTFTTAGTFGYHCELHPFMTGTVIVEN